MTETNFFLQAPKLLSNPFLTDISDLAWDIRKGDIWVLHSVETVVVDVEFYIVGGVAQRTVTVDLTINGETEIDNRYAWMFHLLFDDPDENLTDDQINNMLDRMNNIEPNFMTPMEDDLDLFDAIFRGEIRKGASIVNERTNFSALRDKL